MTATGENPAQSTAIDITGKLMVVIIIILFLFVVTFLFFHLFSKGFWWSHNSHADNNSQSRRRRRQRGGDVVGERGLDPLILNSLPVSVFNSGKDGLELECSVCLSELVEGEKVRVLPKCNHRFHVDCIDMWFQSHSTCPLCRTTLAAPPPSPSLVVEVVEPSSSSSAAAAFPTNVLIWGNHNQTISSSEQNSSNSEGTSEDGMLRIDIPHDSEPTTSSSAGASPTAGGRLRSLKRLLSNSRLNPWSPTATTSLQQQTKPAGHG